MITADSNDALRLGESSCVPRFAAIFLAESRFSRVAPRRLVAAGRQHQSIIGLTGTVLAGQCVSGTVCTNNVPVAVV